MNFSTVECPLCKSVECRTLSRYITCLDCNIRFTPNGRIEEILLDYKEYLDLKQKARKWDAHTAPAIERGTADWLAGKKKKAAPNG